jgi:hypothetical protein
MKSTQTILLILVCVVLMLTNVTPRRHLSKREKAKSLSKDNSCEVKSSCTKDKPYPCSKNGKLMCCLYWFC